MTTATSQKSQTADTHELIASLPKIEGPLVVATDGSPRSDAALRAAHAITALSGQQVLLLAVHVPLPMMGPEVQIATGPNMDLESRKALEARVEQQVARVGVTEHWPIKVTTGFPAATIAKLAERVDARLIVMGLGGHGVFERIFGGEMVLQVLRIGTVPVLAVADSFQALPRRALAAVDFSASSRRALELGAALLRSGSALTLAHVIASETDPVNGLAMDPAQAGSIGRALDQFATAVDLADGVACSRRVVAGDPARELLRIAAELQPDLILTGSHGHNFLSRLLLGSVSTRLLRAAGCSILVAPPLDAPELAAELPVIPTAPRFAFYEWAERLEEFTRRNMWRGARLEVIDPEIGAQILEYGVPFVGASFDPRNGMIHLMFGDRDGRRHQTHCVEDVGAIQIMRGRDGGDLVLRVGHGRGRGQTLLTLER